MQVRLAALKREEDSIQKERDTLETAKMRHIRYQPGFCGRTCPCSTGIEADMLMTGHLLQGVEALEG